MTYSKDELKVLLAVALLRPAAHTEQISRLFGRQKNFLRSLDSLVRTGCIAYDDAQGKLRLLEQPVFSALGLQAPMAAGEMFTDERPLDGPLAEALAVAPPPGIRPAAPPRLPAHPPPGGFLPARAERSNANLTSETLGTFNRSNVSTIKRLNVGSEFGEECEQLLGEILEQVGEKDFFEFWWNRKTRSYLWPNRERVKSLAESLAHLLAGVKSGEVRIRTNFGRALWSQHQFDWKGGARV